MGLTMIASRNDVATSRLHTLYNVRTLFAGGSRRDCACSPLGANVFISVPCNQCVAFEEATRKRVAWASG